jgi:simple sugar transport system permease protein
MVYLSIAAAIFLMYFLARPRRGLNPPAVGEHHAAADAAGINVARYKYLATCIGGGITGLGGLYIVMNSSNGVGGVWVHNCISGYGWLSVALVIFATWQPSRAMYCALIFGALSVMRYYFPIAFIPASIYEIFRISRRSSCSSRSVSEKDARTSPRPASGCPTSEKRDKPSDRVRKKHCGKSAFRNAFI